MSDQRIIFSPERNQWTLADGRHHMEVPEWAREIMRGEFERETRLLQAENAELREQIETLTMYVESDGTRYWVDDDGNQHFDHSAVKDDADELRELVQELYEDQCDECDRWKYYDRMRELGVDA